MGVESGSVVGVVSEESVLFLSPVGVESEESVLFLSSVGVVSSGLSVESVLFLSSVDEVSSGLSDESVVFLSSGLSEGVSDESVVFLSSGFGDLDLQSSPNVSGAWSGKYVSQHADSIFSHAISGHTNPSPKVDL